MKTYLEKLSLYCYICITVFSGGRLLECSDKTTRPIETCIGLVDAILRAKVLGNKLGILTQILISKDYIEKKAFVKEDFWFTPYK